MGRYKEAPDDFVCPYQHRCPHLDGISATWASVQLYGEDRDRDDTFRVIEEQREEIHELHVEIEAKDGEIRLLKTQLTALHRRQFKANRKPPPEPLPETPVASKKRGPPFGHPPWQRAQPDHVDTVVEVPPPVVCPHCGHAHLTPWPDFQDHLQEDIVLTPKTHVTNFRHRQAFCPQCRRPVVHQADGELLNHAIGPVARATGLFLRYGLKIPYRGVQKLFAVCFGLRFVPATALRFDRQAVRKGAALYEDLKAKLKVSPVVHADETHWREDGRNGQLWFGGNADLAVFHVATSRSSEVAVELLGSGFAGTLITDDYAGYNAVNARRRQACWSHLFRKAKEIREELTLPKAPRAPHALAFCKRLMIFARMCCLLGRWFRAGRFTLAKARSLVPRLEKRLLAFASHSLDYKDAETLRLRITVTDFNRLFTFLTVPGVEPTNNHAEQALRGPVIMRKITFGTRSPEGSVAHGLIPSLLLTAQRQGRDPLRFFQTLFTADTATAQAALYRNPPNTS
jgi:hypothetical protein